MSSDLPFHLLWDPEDTTQSLGSSARQRHSKPCLGGKTEGHLATLTPQVLTLLPTPGLCFSTALGVVDTMLACWGLPRALHPSTGVSRGLP